MLRNISFFKLSFDVPQNFDNDPLKMLMRSMIPFDSAAFLMSAMRYKKLHKVAQEDFKKVRRHDELSDSYCDHPAKLCMQYECLSNLLIVRHRSSLRWTLREIPPMMMAATTTKSHQ